MSKTWGAGRKHAAMIADFIFSEKTGGLDELFEKYKNKKYLKQTIRRLKSKGLIIKNNSTIHATRKGLIFFNKYKKPDLKKKKWNGLWYIITFDVPIKEDKKRFALRGLLIKYRFLPLQKSVWISPLAISQVFWEEVIDARLDKFCRMMSVQIIDGDEDLKEHFKDIVDFDK